MEERGDLSSAAALLTSGADQYPHRFEINFELGVVALRREAGQQQSAISPKCLPEAEPLSSSRLAVKSVLFVGN